MLVLASFSFADFTITNLNFAILNSILEMLKAADSQNTVNWGSSKNRLSIPSSLLSRLDIRMCDSMKEKAMLGFIFKTLNNADKIT